MENCIFCKIVEGGIPANKTYEDDQIIAFLDIHPKAPGHTLLIPKEHHRWFYELPDDVAADLFKAAKVVSLKLKEEYQSDFVRLGIVGTDVPHVHVHLIPQNLSQGGPEI